MRLLGIVPARGGSKRLPGKNKKVLGSKPLISWTIDTALASGIFEDVLVTTDDVDIAEISDNAGAYVPWLRPAHLASDTASSFDVVMHAIDFYEKKRGPVDGIMLLQPTSPFRSLGSINRAVSMFEKYQGARSVVSVTKSSFKLSWCFTVEGDKMISCTTYASETALESILRDSIYVLNGLIYLISPCQLKANKGFVSEDSCALAIDSLCESIDIDEYSDWLMAECVLEKGWVV